MSELDAANVALHLRAFRQERGLSLRALAELCDLSANTISLIERGITSPSVSTLQRLATALGVPITAFFVDPGERVDVILTRSDERARSGSGSVVLESLGYGLREQACDPFFVILRPKAHSGRHTMIHGGHELVFCLEGTLDYEIAGEHYRLGPGDSLLFHADQPHQWSNPSEEPVQFLMIMQATEEYQLSREQHLHP
jgi:transcriptional regulator with XRE-family HTH domain